MNVVFCRYHLHNDGVRCNSFISSIHVTSIVQHDTYTVSPTTTLTYFYTNCLRYLPQYLARRNFCSRIFFALSLLFSSTRTAEQRKCGGWVHVGTCALREIAFDSPSLIISSRFEQEDADYNCVRPTASNRLPPFNVNFICIKCLYIPRSGVGASILHSTKFC